MRLTTTFRVDQVDAFLGTVETALLLKIRRDSSGAATILERP
jgi:ferric-dicitrate binding protein FerR (iron transport regulator)